MSAVAYQYDDDIRVMLDGLAGFLKAEVFARHEQNEDLLSDPRKMYDADGRYSAGVLELIRQVRVASAEAGYYSVCVPTEMGGSGLGMTAYYAFWYDLFRQCGTRYWLGQYAGGHWSRGPSAILQKVTPEIGQQIVPGIMSGDLTICFGLSEPGAGSDAKNIKTRAVADGDGWLLSGSKIWTTNSPYADYAMVFAVTDNPDPQARRPTGISLFMVPMAATGVRIEQVIRMWGSAGGDEAILHFDDVRVDPKYLVGELNAGFQIAMAGVTLGRLYNSARAVGLARWALEKALDYSQVRKTFGKSISEYQGVTFPLAESAMELHGAHLMGLNVAQLLDQGHAAQKELAMTKAFATQVGARAVDRAIQTHGAMGFTNEMHLTEAYVTIRKNQVSDGTNEILRRNIVKTLLANAADA